MLRFIFGLVLVFGAIGGMDADPEGINLIAQMSVAVLGLILMFFGSRNLK
jgi:Ca2+/Na+ antiporter